LSWTTFHQLSSGFQEICGHASAAFDFNTATALNLKVLGQQIPRGFRNLNAALHAS
jgi:hypothetical protein